MAVMKELDREIEARGMSNDVQLTDLRLPWTVR